MEPVPNHTRPPPPALLQPLLSQPRRSCEGEEHGLKPGYGTSLVVQWLRHHTADAGGPWVPPLVRDLDPTCCSEDPAKPNE